MIAFRNIYLYLIKRFLYNYRVMYSSCKCLKHDGFKWSLGNFWMKHWRLRQKSIPYFTCSRQRLEYYITLPKSDRGKAVKKRQNRQTVTDFWDTIYPQKVPSVNIATIGKKTGFFLWAYPCAIDFGTGFASQLHQVYISRLFSYGNWIWRQISKPIPG